MIKPQPEIFAYIETDCGFAPETHLFTDDLPANIKTPGLKSLPPVDGIRIFSRGQVGRLFDLIRAFI